jgi:hypothetical protein
MAARTWNKNAASKRIDSRIGGLPLNEIKIKEFVRDTDLRNLPGNVAYRFDAILVDFHKHC